MISDYFPCRAVLHVLPAPLSYSCSYILSTPQHFFFSSSSAHWLIHNLQGQFMHMHMFQPGALSRNASQHVEKDTVPASQLQIDYFDELLAAVILKNFVYKWTVSPLPRPLFPWGLGMWCLERVTLTVAVVFVWLFSDERRSVQPSNQVHRGLHWPSQHLHRNRVLSQRQPAGNVSSSYTFIYIHDLLQC